MSKQTDTNLFMLPPIAVQAGLYQRLLRGVVGYQELGNRIIQEIKAAHAFRQVDTVRELSRILINIPVKEYQLIAQYYLVWCKCRELEYHPQVLERVIEQSGSYKTQAFISRGALSFYQGNLDEAMFFYAESLKTKPAISDYLLSVKEIAIIKSIEGFKKSALKDLESLLPLLKYAEPFTYFDVLNSVAVELCEVGRLQEANNVSALAIASPFGPYYPEWQETYSEVSQKLHKRRSSVTISTPKEKPKEIKPEVKTTAKVIAFPKRVLALADPDVTTESGITLTPLQVLGVILKIVYKDRTTDEDIDIVCSSYYEVMKRFNE